MTWNCDRCGADNADEAEECLACKEADKPFYRKNLRSTGAEDKMLLTLRLNKEERAQLDDIKLILDINSDGGALKLAAFKGWGVLQRTLGRDFLKWLCDKDRLTRGPK
jgi:hypothetical protein